MMRRKMLYTFGVGAMLLLLCACGSAPHDKLNGTWTSDIMTVTIDFPNHKYTGSGFGHNWSHYLELVSEKGNVIQFKESDAVVMCQLESDGTMILTKEGSEGGIPLVMHRVKN